LLLCEVCSLLSPPKILQFQHTILHVSATIWLTVFSSVIVLITSSYLIEPWSQEPNHFCSKLSKIICVLITYISLWGLLLTFS
jgi:hypothetical protein